MNAKSIWMGVSKYLTQKFNILNVRTKFFELVIFSEVLL